MTAFKFSGPGQRETPVVTLPVLVEIVTKLDCVVARTLSAIQAKLLVGYAGGNDQLAVDTIANRFVQEHRKDAAGEYVEHTGGNKLTGLAKDRLEWIEKRYDGAIAHTKRVKVQRFLKSKLEDITKVSNMVNGAILGYDANVIQTVDFLKQKNVKRPCPQDVMTTGELALRTYTEDATANEGIKKETPAEFLAMAEDVTGLARRLIQLSRPPEGVVDPMRKVLRNNEAWGGQPAPKLPKLAAPESPSLLEAPREMRARARAAKEKKPVDILIVSGNKLRRTLSPRERLAIMFQQKYKCALCSEMLVPDTFDVDHKMAKSLGGSDDRDNLQALCLPCHRRKTLDDNDQTRALRAASTR